MEFRLLGPVELWVDGKQIAFPSIKVKQLYAALLWNAGTLIPTTTLIRRVWGEDAPPRELASLQANASKLRRTLSECGDPSISLTQISMGYRLVVPTECIDRNQFERTVSLAGSAAENGNIHEAIRLLSSAETLVRGEEPLTGLVGGWAAEMRAVLEERIREVATQRVTLRLKLGDTHAVLPDLHRLALKYPFDETILDLLMRTLRAAGRTTDALDAFTDFQTKLRAQKGLDAPVPLRRLHEELLRDEHAAEPPRATAPAAAPVLTTRALPPNTLDRDFPGFVGRERDLEIISAEIDAQLAAGSSVLFAIDGMPGVGKTTLALHCAHRLRGRCPDGALQLNLRGHDDHERPTDPETALRLLLEMLGAEPRQIQRAGKLDLAIALWRKHTAGKRLLLLLDNAADAAQVAPLIPGGAGSVVLVTARNRLTGLPEAARHPLEPMGDQEAGALFAHSARISPPTTDPALRDVVTACGGFPLALAVAGNVFRTRPAWSISDLAEHLTNVRATRMRKPDAIIGPLFRVFSTSYRDLPDFERTLLRRLSLNPGLRTHLRAAAALVDAEPAETDAALFNLVEQNLLQENERHHYELHDMMRIFAAHACETEESAEELEAASNRLMYYTVGAVEAATKLFDPHRHVMLAEPARDYGFPDGYGFCDLRQATRWLESEQRWLRTVIEFWFARGHAQEAATLVDLLSHFLDRKNLWNESIALHENALEAWRACGNRVGEARALGSLATAHWRLGSDLALDHATQALALWTALGDRDGSADALLQMGRAYHARHRNAEAIDCFSRCAAHWREVGDHKTAAAALQHLSAPLFDAGRHQEAIATVEEALRLAEVSDADLTTRCHCLNNLGVFLLRLGDHARAEHYYQQALALAGQIGDTNRIAALTMNLALCQIRLGRPEGALPLLDRAFETFSRLDDPIHLTSTLVAQAEAHLALGRNRDAQALIDAAAVPAERIGDAMQLARVHVAHGRIFIAAGELPAALRALRLALIFARRSQLSYMQSLVLRTLGDLYELMRRNDDARRCWRQAVACIDDLPSPEVEALKRKLGTAS